MKSHSKRSIYILAVLFLTVLVVGCSKSQTASTSSSAQAAETYTVKMVFPGDARTEATNRVAEKASEILKAKYGITLEMVRLGYGSFQQEVNLMLSSGEKLDIIPNFALNVSTSANTGQIIALDSLLDTYGQDMKRQIPAMDWNCVTINGQIYAIPNNKEKAQGFGLAMVTSVLDELKYDVSQLKSEKDFTDLYRKVKQLHPNMYPLVSDNGEMGHYLYARDDLGGDFGVLLDPFEGKNTTVVNWFESDVYRGIVQQRYNWAQEGLVLPDASTSIEPAYSLMNAGKGFSYFTNTKPGIDGEWERKAGVPITCIETVYPTSTTSGVANLWFIAHNSQKPEKAMQVLNEMYINPQLADILVNGIEGEHFVYSSDRTVIDYPQGVNASNTTYSSVAWAWLNELITTPWAQDGQSIWKETTAFNESAVNSVAKGFMWDNSAVMNEITACNNVTAKYKNALDGGQLNPATTLPQFIKELKDAGVDAIVAEKQRQLNAWLNG